TTAPMPYSGQPGAPIFLTNNRSISAPRAFAASCATGTPPRGRAIIRGFSKSFSLSFLASFRPASCLLSKGIVPSSTCSLLIALVAVRTEPRTGVHNHFFQRSGLLEQMSGAIDDGQPLRTLQHVISLLVQIDHRPVETADNQQGW